MFRLFKMHFTPSFGLPVAVPRPVPRARYSPPGTTATTSQRSAPRTPRRERQWDPRTGPRHVPQRGVPSSPCSHTHCPPQQPPLALPRARRPAKEKFLSKTAAGPDSLFRLGAEGLCQRCGTKALARQTLELLLSDVAQRGGMQVSAPRTPLALNTRPRHHQPGHVKAAQ
jgi:hypothetical protein